MATAAEIEIVQRLISRFGITKDELYPTETEQPELVDAEVLEFRDKGGFKWALQQCGRYKISGGSISASLSTMLFGNTLSTIHTVRRKSDGLVVSVGDVVKSKLDSYTVKSFELLNGYVYINKTGLDVFKYDLALSDIKQVEPAKGRI